jgi:hypothetical protein
MTTQRRIQTPLKIRRARLRQLPFILCALCVLGCKTLAQDFQTVHDGVEYAHVEHKLRSDPVKINLLRLDLTKVRLDVLHAMDAAIGTEKTSSLAARHGAVAAINAGFFRLDRSEFAGDASSFLVIDGRTLSEGPHQRAALIINNRSGRSGVAIHKLLPLRNYFKVGKPYFEPEITLSGINREGKANEVIIYGPEFAASTRTKVSGTEVILTRCRRRKEHRGFLFTTCSRFDVKRNSSDNPIPRDGFVISFGSEAKESLALFEKEIANLSNGKSPSIYLETSIFGLDGGDTLLFTQPETDIVAGVPQLIKNGKIDITWEQEKASRSFAETRHPRTAVAKLSDGRFLMMTVDGRQPGVSVGMNLQELGEYLLSLGAVEAMNLDGGGSTTMFLDGKVVNTPSDKEGERKVGDAILVTLRKKRSRRK